MVQVEGESLVDATEAKPKAKEIIHDHPIFKKVDDGDMEGLQNYIEVEGVSVEIPDQNGMTPLMHACWKGHTAIVRFESQSDFLLLLSIIFTKVLNLKHKVI